MGITGSVAAYKACEITRAFKKKGVKVRCVLSRDAGKFVTPLTFQALSGEKVYQDMFELAEDARIEHISLAEEADCVVIAPATADIIARIASGLADDLLSSVVCTVAAKKPVVIAPAMNSGMYANTILRDKIAYLKEKGFVFIGPREGELACGASGEGRLAETDEIVERVISLMGS